MKKVIAVIVGVIVAGAAVWGIEKIGHAVYPPPADIDFENPDMLRTYVESLPVGALLLVLVAWGAGAFAGSFVAGKIGGGTTHLYAWIVSGLVLLGAGANMAMIPHPVWMMIAAVILIPSAGYAAYYLTSGVGRAGSLS